MTSLIVVDGVVPAPGVDDLNLRTSVWSYALDQRAFGPRKLWVVFADGDGRFRALAFTDRRHPFHAAFDACLAHLGGGSAAAVVFHDAPVVNGPPSADFLERFEAARGVAADRGVHLVDWIDCDDGTYRASRLETMVLADQPDWWDVPVAPERDVSDGPASSRR